MRHYWQQKSKNQAGFLPPFTDRKKALALLERGPSCRIKPRTARWLEVRGEELAVDGLEVVLQHLFAGIKGSAHDGDDTAELAVGAEVADALGISLSSSGRSIG